MSRIAVKLRVTGRVQGVGYRENMVRVAAELGVKGWVMNEYDGSVKAFLQGEDQRVMQAVEWAMRGPPSARVDSAKADRVAPRSVHGFRIWR